MGSTVNLCDWHTHFRSKNQVAIQLVEFLGAVTDILSDSNPQKRCRFQCETRGVVWWCSPHIFQLSNWHVFEAWYSLYPQFLLEKLLGKSKVSAEPSHICYRFSFWYPFGNATWQWQLRHVEIFFAINFHLSEISHGWLPEGTSSFWWWNVIIPHWADLPPGPPPPPPSASSQPVCQWTTVTGLFLGLETVKNLDILRLKWDNYVYPLVKHTNNYGKSSFFMGKSTINCHFQ